MKKEMPITWKETLSKHLLTMALEHYQDAYSKASPEEIDSKDAILEPMILIARRFPDGVEPPEEIASELPPDLRPAMVQPLPPRFTHEFMNQKGKAALRGFIRMALDSPLPWPLGDTGPAEAVYVISEIWTRGSCATKEERQKTYEKYGSVADTPDARSGILIALYSYEGTQLLTQLLKDGAADGEPKFSIAGPEDNGNMVVHGLGTKVH